MFNALDICAGTGIGSWVWEQLGGRTVCYVENDSYCQQLLQARMYDGRLGSAPIWDDLRTFDGQPWRGRVDFLFGGIPCQPWSQAGRRDGEADERDLWPDFLRVLREVAPRFALVENVPGLTHRRKDKSTKEQLQPAIGRLLGDLAESGYDAEWDCIPACAVGAYHKRDRVWIVAYPNGAGRQQDARGAYGNEDADEGRATLQNHQPTSHGESNRTGQVSAHVADTDEPGLEERNGEVVQERGGQRVIRSGGTPEEDVPNASGHLRGASRDAGPKPPDGGRYCRSEVTELGDSAIERLPDWASGKVGQPSPITQFERPSGREVERDFRGVAHGVSARVDRLKALGNAWVPQVAEIPMRRIVQYLQIARTE